MARKKQSLPFDKAGGVVVTQRRMYSSTAFLNLSPQAKALREQMQVHWRNDKPVAFGIREAEEKIPCSKKIAIRAFKELEKNGFIVMVDECFFDSTTNSRSRTWRLTWLPFNGRAPTNEWEKVHGEIPNSKKIYRCKSDT